MSDSTNIINDADTPNRDGYILTYRRESIPHREMASGHYIVDFGDVKCLVPVMNTTTRVSMKDGIIRIRHDGIGHATMSDIMEKLCPAGICNVLFGSDGEVAGIGFLRYIAVSEGKALKRMPPGQHTPLAFKLAVRDALFRRLGSAPPETVSAMANDANDFVAYCAGHFPKDRQNATRCAVGILAKLDSQKHPERYTAYDMNSMFDIRRCAIRLLQAEDDSSIRTLVEEIANLANG